MPKLVTLSEAARALRLSEWTVRQLARDGKLRSVRLVRDRIHFTEEQLAEAVRAAEQPALVPA